MNFEKVIFDGWEQLLGVLITAPVLYGLVVLSVRLSGKRTTGQMNNFDWIVTVAMGATMASSIVTDSVSLSEGALAVVLLMGMQWMLTEAAQKSQAVSRAIKSKPRLIMRHGQMLDDALRAERLTEDEVIRALRSDGVTSLDQVGWLLLENDGTFSLLRASSAKDGVDETVLPEWIRDGSPGRS